MTSGLLKEEEKKIYGFMVFKKSVCKFIKKNNC